MNSTVTCVCLTRYPDRAPMLSEALHAFSLQTYPQKRLVIVNDGEPLRSLSPNVQVVQCERNLSIGQKRQCGLISAAESWVCTWDDDDFFLPMHISSLIEVATEKNAHAVRHSVHALTDPSLRVACIINRPTPADLLLWGPTAREVGGYHNQAYAEDWSLYARLRIARVPFAFSPRLTYLRRVHASSTSRKYERNIWDIENQMIESLMDQREWPKPEVAELQKQLDSCLQQLHHALVVPV